PPVDPDPRRRRRQTLFLMVERLALLARHAPVLVLLEDAHWIDPTTLELLEMSVKRSAALPVLFVVTCRPEFAPSWEGWPNLTIRTLTRLSRDDSGTIIRQVAGGKALPDQIREQIQTKTDGVPLFIEELTKAVLESDKLAEAEDRWLMRGQAAVVRIPATL